MSSFAPINRPIVPDEAFCACIEVLGARTWDVWSSCRNKRLARTRGIIAFVIRELTGASFPEIAVLLGRPNHSSAFDAYRKMNKHKGKQWSRRVRRWIQEHPKMPVQSPRDRRMEVFRHCAEVRDRLYASGKTRVPSKVRLDTAIARRAYTRIKGHYDERLLVSRKEPHATH